jgi:serine protease Do
VHADRIHKDTVMSPQKSSGAALSRADFSAQLAAAVGTAAQSVVAIHARRRIPSSGIVWREDVVVSASHTVRRDDDITVALPNGESINATIAGRDPATDLIALRLPHVEALHVAPKASDAPTVGTLVLAVGRPGPDVTASVGIISAVNDGVRTWRGERLERVLRLDLAIYDGFSGGPLVDAAGNVLGVNSSALARGAAMALPVAVVDRVVDELLRRGHVRRPFVGVAVQPITLSTALVQRHNLARDTALMIMSTVEGGPAERANLFAGDILVEANGQPLQWPTDLREALSSVAVGDSTTLAYLRGGAMHTVSIAPDDTPSE